MKITCPTRVTSTEYAAALGYRKDQLAAELLAVTDRYNHHAIVALLQNAPAGARYANFGVFDGRVVPKTWMDANRRRVADIEPGTQVVTVSGCTASGLPGSWQADFIQSPVGMSQMIDLDMVAAWEVINI